MTKLSKLMHSKHAQNGGHLDSECGKFKEAVSSVLSFLGIAKLYPHQENALFQFLSRKDLVVNLPTSYGKSLIYQIAPLVASKL